MNLRRTVRRALHGLGFDVGALSPNETHAYWSAPPDASNKPTHYAAASRQRSQLVLDLLRRHNATPDWSVLEIGCNAGRNLDHLYQNGYQNLAGIELSKAAVAQFRLSFPSAYNATSVSVGSLEDQLPTVDNETYDAVFSLAVLEHIHHDHDFVLDDVARVAGRILITIEDEECVSERHFPRNYRREFEQRGLRQVHQETGSADLPASFVARVFAR